MRQFFFTARIIVLLAAVGILFGCQTSRSYHIIGYDATSGHVFTGSGVDGKGYTMTSDDGTIRCSSFNVVGVTSTSSRHDVTCNDGRTGIDRGSQYSGGIWRRVTGFSNGSQMTSWTAYLGPNIEKYLNQFRAAAAIKKKQQQATTDRETVSASTQSKARRQQAELDRLKQETALTQQRLELERQKTKLEQQKRKGELAKASPTSFPKEPVEIAYARVPIRPDDIAVIIGNANYEAAGKDIPDVVPAYADAEGIMRYVRLGLGIEKDNIISIRDATQAKLVSVFGTLGNAKGQLYNWVEPGESRVFVYYSGHGAPGGADGSAYLVPTDANAATLELNGYSLSTLYANLAKIPAKSVTVVLESCFSGASEGGAVISNASPVFAKANAPPTPANLTVISAGAANQIASWEKDKSHGLFTKYYLLGMSGAADAAPYGNEDQTVGLAELKRYLGKTVTKYARRYYGREQTVQIVAGRQSP